MSSLPSNLARSATDAARDDNSSSDASIVIAELNNNDNRIAVRTKTARALMLSLAVYRMCTMAWLVNLAPRLISLSEKLRVSAPVYWVVKRTFFHQFCGGETADACISTMQALRASGIGSILDLSIEADLDGDDHPADTDPSAAALARVRHNEHADHALALTKQCLDTARMQPGSFAAVKVTALGPPSLLRDLTVLLQSLHDAFHRADTDGHGHLDHLGFRDIVRSLPGAASVPDADALAAALFGRPDAGIIDLLHFSAALSIDNSAARPLLVSSAGLTPSHVEDYEAMMHRLRELCDHARECGVRLMIDAEQSYFQRAIDHVAMRMEQEYNRQREESGPLVFNTYQMYLKESLPKLKMDVERARREGFVLGAKLVRGAYMVSERKRASDLGLPSPIQPDLAATHASYDAGVELLLQVIGEARRDDSPLSPINSPVVFMIASHNRESVIAACSGMERRGVRPEDGVIMFGQLLGMCDQLSYTLGRHGYAVYKYLPYGEVREVIPYLIRRAQENSSVLGSVNSEQQLLWNELKRRVLGSGKVEGENAKTK